MNATDDSSERSERIRQDAAASMIRHVGPTADRYAAALERYVQAVADLASGPGRERRQPQRYPASQVADVMNRSVVTAYPGALFKDIAAAFARNHIDAVPVIDEDRHVVGIVTASDLLARVAGARPVPRGHRLTAALETVRKDHALTAKDLMTSPAITTRPHTSAAQAARLAARNRVRCLPVVNRKSELVGLVTRADLIKVFLRSDEAILEDIERDVLSTSAGPAAAHVHAHVHDGVVTLTGRVEAPTIAVGLVRRVSGVSGVVAVEDELERDERLRMTGQYLP